MPLLAEAQAVPCSTSDITLLAGPFQVAIMLENIELWREAPVWTPDKIEDATREWFQFLTPGGVS